MKQVLRKFAKNNKEIMSLDFIEIYQYSLCAIDQDGISGFEWSMILKNKTELLLKRSFLPQMLPK